MPIITLINLRRQKWGAFLSCCSWFLNSSPGPGPGPKGSYCPSLTYDKSQNSGSSSIQEGVLQLKDSINARVPIILVSQGHAMVPKQMTTAC